MPNGPSGSVEHTISGPSAKRSGERAESIACVTASLEFGLITPMRGRGLVIAVPAEREARRPKSIVPAAQSGHHRTVPRHPRLWVPAQQGSPGTGARETSMHQLDLVIRGGTVVTASDMMEADVGISAETVAALGRGLEGRRVIDARGKLVTPGGVDSHCHIEQLAASGLMNADTFESATTAAAFGGTTTVVSFAAQHVGMCLTRVVEDYHALAKKGAGVDYAFHM